MKKLHCIILLWALLLNLCSASVYAEGNMLFFKGSAGTLAKAIAMLRQWAKSNY